MPDSRWRGSTWDSSSGADIMTKKPRTSTWTGHSHLARTDPVKDTHLIVFAKMRSKKVACIIHLYTCNRIGSDPNTNS
jgi:hypothetical protein